MSNNKQSSSIDAIMKFMKENGYFIGNDLYQFFKQAKAMHKEEVEASYADGYSEGYNRALELVKWKIDNEIKGGNNEQQ